MKISFRPTEISDSSNLYRWQSDPQILHLVRPFRSKERFEQFELTEESVQKSMSQEMRNSYMILADSQAIGEVNFLLNPPHVCSKAEQVAWMAIIIGETQYHGKGVGLEAMSFIEEKAKQAGAEIFELGVFEFNERAYQFYLNCGYQEIQRIKDFTFWQDRMWCDIRMVKRL